MATDRLQKIFKTLADPTRVRLLALLEREELAVQDLMDVMEMAQSRVSRHLAILREAGLLRDRKDGTFTYYRMATPLDANWGKAWRLVTESLSHDSRVQRDVANLERVLALRQTRTRSWFDDVAPQWDSLRKVFNDDTLRARAINRALPPNLVAADIGTGTGILASELASLGARVIAVDPSPRMLEAARENFRAAGLETRIELRAGDARALPLRNAEVDTALAHMVLHYLPSPREAISEMARVVKPGGVVTLVDFCRHDKEWMRDELGVQWLGFAENEVLDWLQDAGLIDIQLEVQSPSNSKRELPSAFIASGRKPRAERTRAQRP